MIDVDIAIMCCDATELASKRAPFVRECNESETGEAVLLSWL